MVYDPEIQKYRLYYEAGINPVDERVRGLKMLESEDMINFTQVLSDDGSPIIFSGGSGLHGGTVIYDPMDPDPSRRYKFCGMTEYGDPTKDNPVNLAFSPDGIHWENHKELIVNAHKSDTLNKLYFNPLTKEYNLLHRSAYVDRRVSIRTSKDLINWSEPKIMLHPGGVYNDNYFQMQHYALTAGWFDGIFYGLLSRFTTDLHNMEFSKMFGVMEPELTYSYDGNEFLYTSCDSLVERPMAPTPGWAGFLPCDMSESIDGKNYYILLGAYSFVHGTLASNKENREKLKAKGYHNAIQVYKIRKDGFCGLESVGPGGMVITKSLQLLKDDLTFNIRAACGSVRFGIMNAKGEYLDGYSLDDCIPFELDEGFEIKPQWKEKELKDIVGERIRIVVELNSAILHAMTMTARPYIRMKQKSFADPQGIFE